MADLTGPDASIEQGEYGFLTILVTPPAVAGSAAAAAAKPPILPALPNQSHAFTDNTFLVIKEWYLFFVALLAYLAALITSPAAAASIVEIVAPSVDDVDAEWYGTGSINATSDPVTFSATFVGQSRFPIEMVLLSGGIGYGSAPTVKVTGADGGGWAAGAIATVAAGKVVSLSPPTSWYGLVAPLTVTFTGGGGSQAVAVAELGRQFAVGDYIVWNDPTVLGDGSLQYEIDLITAIVPVDATHATLTLARAAPGALSGAKTAQYGSFLASHASCAFYRLENQFFQRPYDPAGGPQLLKLPWPNQTVVAAEFTAPGQAPLLLNLAPNVYLPGTTTPNPRTTPPAPGLRTMCGAAYTSIGISGGLTVGALTNAVSAQAWESVRTAYAKVLTAPVGPVSFNGDANAAIVLYIVFIAPAGTVWLLDTVVIDDSAFNSYASSNAPDGRNMPFHFFWPFNAPNADWPPNRLPKLTTALTVPVTVDPTQTIVFSPDGLIRGIVAQVGSTTAGSDLSVTVQT